jgi:hypothetical protein
LLFVQETNHDVKHECHYNVQLLLETFLVWLIFNDVHGAILCVHPAVSILIIIMSRPVLGSAARAPLIPVDTSATLKLDSKLPLQSGRRGNVTQCGVGCRHSDK